MASVFLRNHITQSKESNLKITLAIMLGIFMGIAPVWGYQMLITLFLAYVFKLNKVIAIVAANISLPPYHPVSTIRQLLHGMQGNGSIYRFKFQ